MNIIGSHSFRVDWCHRRAALMTVIDRNSVLVLPYTVPLTSALGDVAITYIRVMFTILYYRTQSAKHEGIADLLY